MSESILTVDDAGETMSDSGLSVYDSVKCMPEALKTMPEPRLSEYCVETPTAVKLMTMT